MKIDYPRGVFQEDSFYGHPLSYWIELDARARENGRDTLIMRCDELKKDLAVQREINEHLLKACIALLEENKKGWK